MKKIVISLMSVLLLALVLSGCAQDVADPLAMPGSGADEETVVNETEVPAEADIDAPTEPDSVEATSEDPAALPMITYLPDGLGQDVYLEAYAGKMLFLNFFGTWCTYCMQELPDFQEFADDHADQVTIVLVNALETERGKTAQDILDWYDESGYTMPLLFDMDKSLTRDYYGAIQGFPTTFVFDEEQNFVGYIPGMMDYEFLSYITETYTMKP